ncbi:hypothetical protein L484_010341 [Morus notabilis]|uniref:DUF506 family protein n=1 Tax=Morus notabilis TaxID=981085 RepID=W9QNF7_9ROSA|nr:uncharacterized protein LOC21393636 [Morus notabilis]EXB44650.1 hypothetical protein L484_010341 [Morus notabilis]
MVEIRGVAATSLDDMVFEYLEYGEESSPESRFISGDDCYDDDGEEERSSFDVEESKAFWDEQKKLLQGLLYRTNSIESKIRQATKEVLKDAKNSQCGCARFAAAVAGGGCWSCLRREVCNRLINLGYDCAICKSKWRSSSSIPSGEHSYLEVVDRSSAKRGETRVVIELNFRAEFEMSRASEEYNLLIGQLPEVFVGKAERLRGMIKILCSAAKKCMKEKNMHLGPWRKHKYMQAKWLGRCDRSAAAPLPVGNSGRTAKSKASMLTFDLLEAMPIPGLRRTAVEVSVI